MSLRIALVLLLALPAPAAAGTGILATGDFGVGGKPQRDLGAAMRSYAERMPTKLLVTLGDNDYTRGRVFASSWRASFGWLPAAGIDVAGALGNHDVEVRGGRYQFRLLGMPGPYYARRVEDVEVFVLDSNRVTATQTRWLSRALSRSTARWKIAVLHHPPFTCGGYFGDLRVRRSWVPLFERHRVRLVLSGHDHNYQRFAPRRGVTYVVHGGGGPRLYPLKRCPAGYPRRLAARAARGFLHLDVEERSLTIRALSLGGRVVDRASVSP